MSLTKFDVHDPEKVAKLVADLMPVGDGASPTALHGFRDDRGNCRRVVARYPNGWEATLRFNTRMELTSRAARIVFRSAAAE